jgi:FkbM family methyltransferase
MRRLKQYARRSAHRFGIDIVHYPLHDATARTVQMLNHFGVSWVVDVGANDGGFATALRDCGFTGQITSFEPLNAPFAALKRKAASDAKWDVEQCAVGACDGEVSINVSANSGLSSSVLPMLDAHLKAAPDSHYVRVEQVRQERLDRLLPKAGAANHSKVFVKIDVQGYEAQVLDGASDLFAQGIVAGMQLELSLEPLYAEAMDYRQALDRAESLGFKLMGLDPVFADPRSGRLLQADAVFFADI